MRSIKANDYWRGLRKGKKKFRAGFKEINMHNCKGINTISFKDGVYAICGLNGAGKSTIIAAMKAVLGLSLNKFDELKLDGSLVEAHITYDNKEYECSNRDGETLISQIGDSESIIYLDAHKAMSIQQFFIFQENIDELIDQYDENLIEDQQLEEINYLIGSEYDKVTVVEVDDEITYLGSIPFFKVQSSGVNYDSRTMGTGEHFLLYLFWMLEKISLGKVQIVLLEEPESFVGIQSQMRLMNIIAMLCNKYLCSFYVTSHSPFIIRKIDDNHVCVVLRTSGVTSFLEPDGGQNTNVFLGSEEFKDGTFFVEDRVAKIFLQIILEEELPSINRRYLIAVGGSESEITTKLTAISSDAVNYNLYGIYDGDQKANLEEIECSWPITVLPVQKDIETEMQELFKTVEMKKKLAEKIGKKESDTLAAFTLVAGMDHHDWLLDLCKYLSIDEKVLIRAFYHIWKENHAETINEFIKSLKENDVPRHQE